MDDQHRDLTVQNGPLRSDLIARIDRLKRLEHPII